jgi:hypothetical protein
MVRIFLTVVILILSSFACAQQKTEKPPQSPRQALIEMARGGGSVIYKHLTVEMQQYIQKAAKAYVTAALSKAAPQQQASSSVEEKNSPDSAPQQEDPSSGNGNEGKTVSEVHTELHQADGGGMMGFNFGLLDWRPLGDKNLQAFDSGPVLFTYTDPSTKEKMEIRVENDDLRGDADDVQLSLHFFRDGQEQSIPLLQTFTVGLKMQEGVWRLNEISTEMKAAIGDPKFFEDMKKAFAPEPSSAPTHAAIIQPKEEEHPAMPIFSVVNMLAFAEDMYARSNPDAGFTCSLSDLVGDKAGATFAASLDPQIATGTYNGYRFSISGCGGQPSEIFHLIAEPVTPGGKAYCVNSTHVVRSSDDGRGATCLASGKAFNGE